MVLIDSKYRYNTDDFRWESNLYSSVPTTLDFNIAEREIFKELNDYCIRHQIGRSRILDISYSKTYSNWKVHILHERGVFE